MNNAKVLRTLICLLLADCFALKDPAQSQTMKQDNLSLFDASRNRTVPVALYLPVKQTAHPKVIIVSHGYQANRSGSNKNHSYLCQKLATAGYYVASIQHELPTDSLIPSTGIPQVIRRPHWERGAANILFVLNELKRTKPDLDYKHVTLIGHSNGGDMSMLFAQKYPDLIDKVISPDNRRMPFPRTKHPKLYSLRSSDQPADEGVLPHCRRAKRARHYDHSATAYDPQRHGRSGHQSAAGRDQSLCAWIFKRLMIAMSFYLAQQ